MIKERLRHEYAKTLACAKGCEYADRKIGPLRDIRADLPIELRIQQAQRWIDAQQGFEEGCLETQAR